MRKNRISLAGGVVALALLLGAGAAQAGTIEPTILTSDGGANATGIQNLTVGIQLFDVTFVRSSALALYGDPGSPDYDFNDPASATLASDDVNAALNTDTSVVTVGPGGSVPGDRNINYGIGFGNANIASFEVIAFADNVYGGGSSGWEDNDVDASSYAKTLTYASFSLVPEPGTALLLGLGLSGLGIVGRSRRKENPGTA